MRRRLLLSLAVCFAVAMAIIATLPLWLGTAVGALGPHWGLTVGSYERLGYGRFAMHEVEFRRGSVHVTANRVEADTPFLWQWRRWTGKPNDIVADHWAVDVEPSKSGSTAPESTSAATGWMPLRATLQRVIVQLDRWLPRAKTGEGVVRWRGGELAIGGANWSARTLKVERLRFRTLEANATAEFPASADEFRVAAQLADDLGAAKLTSRGVEIAGDITWWQQPAAITAKFAGRGWMPAEASLRSDAWKVPGEKLKLGDLYAMVSGRGRIDWKDEHFSADIAMSSEPLKGKKAPPMDLVLRGRGDAQAFTAEVLHATLPGITADLSEPVTIDRSGKLRESGARFAVNADLSKQPWLAARGMVSGEARVISGAARAPNVEFKLDARDVAAEGVALSSATIDGQFAWPRIEVTHGTIAGGAGERIELKGGWDFHAQELLATTVEGQLRRATLARWLPAQPEFSAITLKAEAAGPLATVKHSGEAKAEGVVFSGVKPLNVALTWNGAGRTIERFSAEAAAGATRLSVAGAVDADSARVTDLELQQKDAVRLKLEEPATIRWRPALQVEKVNLAGPDGSITANMLWGPTGSLAIAVHNVSSDWLGDLITLPGPAWQLTSVAITGSWDRGPMTFSAVLGAAIALGDDRRAMINLAASGNKNGVRLEALRAAEGAESIVHAEGALPVVLTPGGNPLVKIDEGAPLAIEAATAPNAAFWKEIGALTGLELTEPRAAAHLKGTWNQPAGDVQVKAGRIAADPKRFKRPLPAIEALDVALATDGAGVRLETFSFQVEGQVVRAQGRLPIKSGDWSRALKDPLAFARRGADASLEIPDADVAVFARYLPTYIAPIGRMHLDVSYRDGRFDGNLRLKQAATRPLGPLGVLQDIDADIRLAGRAMELRSVTAKSGGETVQLSGRVELPEGTASGSAPRVIEPKFDLAMKGKNLPFVRRTGLLVRGDIDLKLTTPERVSATSGRTPPPRLSGTVHLHDSLFLQDVRALLPGGARSKTRRPPYFAVETPPLDQWQLDVNVEGERFMQLRTTVFNGVASARFHLGGTLNEPVALGDATIPEGRVRLPFATFDVQEGRVTLTREQPYEPQIWVAGTTRRYDYDLRMEISGAASAPLLAFSSTPPLDHGQILLMVMAGEAPKDEVTFSDRQRAARLGEFVGQSLLASFGDSENADRLSISSGEKVSRQGRETYDVEYKLSDRLSATGEYDEFDEFNAGVKWRLFSKGGRGATKHETAKK